MILQFLGLASGLVCLIGYPFYIRDIFWGTTRPQRVSWFIWSFLGLIIFFSNYAEGATNTLWLAGAQLAGMLAIFVSSIWKGTGGYHQRDVFGLLAGITGIILWYITRHAAIALVLAIVVDLIGTFLTLPKAFQHPESETLFTWQADCFAGLLAALAVGALNPILLVYPLHIFISNGAVVAAIILGRRKKIII